MTALLHVVIVAALAQVPCPVTLPQNDVHGTSSCPGNYGNASLLVGLEPEIEFRDGGPGFILRDGSFAWKFAWCAKVRGRLSIHGRRIDGAAPPARAEISQSGEPGVVPSDIIFPTTGCWRITGTIGTASITFITHVVDHRTQK